ncbi:MAG TPA: polysaccharide biosynthesis/export family protein, partial [Gemmatimonadales bacterium]|nr:polysaccharide biosynthesis/export family protein [Gemmatimonadales bacterium]
MPLRRILLRAARMAGAVLLFMPFALPAAAQVDGQIPDPATAELMLRNNPTLQQQLRERILRSGLSEEQIRQRLRAAGYPESMLDQYVGVSQGRTSPLDDQAALDAVRTLGLVGTPQLDSLEMMLNQDVWMPPYDPYLRDSLRADSLGIPWTRPLEIFGLDVFRARTSRFQPTLQGPVGDSYRLGPGDRLALILTGEVERALSLDVSRDGFIIVPEVGQMHVANLTLGQFEEQLYQRLRRVYSGISRSPGARTQFEVTVARLRNIQVFVTGAVERPG